jgi:alkylation response protein AidB-like acyl-CoA dehydrogenase
MLEMTVGYVTERRQFGVPIGSFQAVKHHLTNASLAVEFAEPLALRAANSLTNNLPDVAVHASMAKAKASDAARGAAAASLQCHGAIEGKPHSLESKFPQPTFLFSTLVYEVSSKACIWDF